MLDPKMQEGFSKKILPTIRCRKSEESASDLPAPSLIREAEPYSPAEKSGNPNKTSGGK
jgi:hypothetical protein